MEMTTPVITFWFIKYAPKAYFVCFCMQTIIALGDAKRHPEVILKDIERACEIYNQGGE